MFHGTAPTEEQRRMLDAAQILQMEHSFNCGTFAGRVCASSLAPIQSSISASIGTLFGKLHGGADQAALEMAMAIGSPDKAEAYVRDCLANKEKIMGMGHREYRTVDPRAKLLKPMAVELCQDEESKNLLATLVAVEEACQREFAAKGKEIWANVEFYKGAVFHSLGIPTHYLHGHVRDGARVRLHRPLPGVPARQPTDTSARALHRSPRQYPQQVRRLTESWVAVHRRRHAWRPVRRHSPNAPRRPDNVADQRHHCNCRCPCV